MYKQSVERWKNYEAHLAPLVAALNKGAGGEEGQSTAGET